RLLEARVVERAVEPSVGRERPRDERLHVALPRDVAPDEDRVAARSLDPGDDLLAFALPAPVDDDLRALLGEFDGGGATDAGVATRDENDFGVLHGRPRSKGGAGSDDPIVGEAR